MDSPATRQPPIPRADQVFVEQFPEPITGWTMIGAGASWDAPSVSDELEAVLLYDGDVRVSCAVKRTATGYEFGMQAPHEASLQQVSVQLRLVTETVTLFDEPFIALRHRGGSDSQANAKPIPRWLSPLRTLARSMANGDSFRIQWWRDRVRRYQEFALKARQRVRDKLLVCNGHQPRSVHDAFVEAGTLTGNELAAMREKSTRFRFQPTFSILCPVYNVEPKWLAAAIESVLNQAYSKWELCLADDASTDPATIAFLNSSLPKDARIKLVKRPHNGHICAATNSAAELATGEFVVLLDNDDLLAPQALFRYAELLQSHPDADVLYSDEDKITATGHRYDPQFKPDWSPELLLSYNYINHITCIRRTVFDKAGRFRIGYEGAQDLDLLLRVTELTDRIHHVPETLYHWRALETSTASAAGVKDYVRTSAKQAVTDALARRKITATLIVPKFAHELNLPALALDGSDDGPSVAIIIRGTSAQASLTVRAIKHKTAYRNYTTYLVLDSAPPADALNRLAASRSEEWLLFLEAGIEPTDTRWLSRLIAYGAIPGVGASGGLIRDRDGRIVSAGTVLEKHPRDAFHGVRTEPVSYYFLAEVARNVSAVGRDCLLTRRSLFDRLGGFDGERFGHTLFDVDYCLRLAGQGLRSVHVGGAELQWSEPMTGRHDAPTERQHFRTAYGQSSDPYSNVNFSQAEQFTPSAEPPPRPASNLAGVPVRVLFATHNLSGFEGAPKVLRDVALGLTVRGTITASLYAPAPGKTASVFSAANIPVFAEQTEFAQRFIDGQWTPREYATAQRHFTKVLKQVKPQVVVANTLGLFPIIEAATRLGIPAQLVIHESYSETLFHAAFSPYGRWRCERAFQFAERVIFVSKSCADLYQRLNSRKNFTVINNALDPQPFDEFLGRMSKADAIQQLPEPLASRVRFVTVGTVCERKAQHTLVEAAAIVAKSRRDFVCYLVGAREGLPYLSYVQNLIRARGVEDVVKIVPETDQVWTYLRAADVFVCTSYVEAFSLSVLEAEAFGLPIVSTPCGGLDEQVVWGQNALRFEYGNAEQLARHMQSLIQTPQLRAEMGRQSRAAFELSQTPSEMLNQYEHAILTAAATSRPSQVAKISPS